MDYIICIKPESEGRLSDKNGMDHPNASFTLPLPLPLTLPLPFPLSFLYHLLTIFQLVGSTTSSHSLHYITFLFLPCVPGSSLLFTSPLNLRNKFTIHIHSLGHFSDPPTFPDRVRNSVSEALLRCYASQNTLF